MSQFRKLALSKIAASAGILSNIRPEIETVKPNLLKAAGILTGLVEQYYGVKPFKAAFLSLPPGPERTKLIIEAIKKRSPKNLVTITVDGPNGTKIKLKAMRDYVTIEGVRVPLSAKDSEALAYYHNMRMLTSKMSRILYEKSPVKIMPKVLSAGGMIGGRYYSPEEVVASKIQDSDSAVAYSELMEKALKSYKGDIKGAPWVHGYMKDIIQPTGDPNKTHYDGLYNPITGKAISSKGQTSHSKNYVGEYVSGSKWIANSVEVIHPDGRVENTTFDALQNDPIMYAAVADIPGVKRYNPKT